MQQLLLPARVGVQYLRLRVSVKVPPRLVLFTGLGVGPEMMLRQRQLPGIRVETPAWTQPEPWEGLRRYSLRMAQLIDPTPPLVIGGLSLGAMVALEAARALKPKGVLMISGAFSGGSIGWSTYPLQWLAPYIPLLAIDLMLRMSSLGFFQFTPLPPHARGYLTKVMQNASPSMFQWGARAVVEWAMRDAPPCPVRSIHGSVDKVIPIKHVHPTEIVRGGGHLIHLTHPEQVNSFLTRWTHRLASR